MSAFGFESTALEVVDGIDLTGKRAIVTGGSSGIGVETARALAGAGAEVTLAVRNVEAGERVATEVGAANVAYLELADQRYQDPSYIENVRKAGFRLKTPEQGAATSVLLATSPELEGIGGRYYEDCAEAQVVDHGGEIGSGGVAPYALDADNAERLWELSERLLRAHV
jgi:short chain dehydrogenase